MPCLGREWIPISLWVDICAVPAVDAVATGEVSCYNCIGRLLSNSNFSKTIFQGFSSVAQRPLNNHLMALGYPE